MQAEHATRSNPPPRKPARKVNVTRGMFRAWVLFSVLWVISFLGLSAPDWYEAATYWYRGLEIRVTKTSCREDVHSCFDVAGPGNAKYIVQFDQKTKMTPDDIATVVKYDMQRFNDRPSGCRGKTKGYGCDPIFIDLSNEEWLVTGRSLAPNTVLFTTLAFAVPAGLLALGVALGWVATGFRQN